MYCNNCGTYLNDDAKFCSKCGTKVVTSQTHEDELTCEEIAYKLKNDGYILLSDTEKTQEWKNFDTGKIIEVEKLDNSRCKIKNSESFSYSKATQDKSHKPKNDKKMKIIIGIIVTIVLGIMAWQQMRMQFGKEEYDLGEKAEKQKDFELATKHFKKSCDYNNADGCMQMGFYHAKGIGVEKDDNKAFIYSKKACEGGSSQGCTNLGYDYEIGSGTEKNIQKAYELYQQGCDGGNGHGCQNLGWSYLYGNDAIGKDTKKALELFEKSCKLDKKFCRGLGFMYEDGIELKQDYEQAANNYEKSCDEEDWKSCTNLGYFYETIANDNQSAIKYYAQGCDGGNARGCSNFAFMYENGKGVTKDIETAKRFYKQGCDGGHDWGCQQLDRINSAPAVEAIPSE